MIMGNKRILPAYPLFVKDPNFSLWSVTDELNASNVRSWWGEEKKIYGFIKTGGKTYCFLGDCADLAGCGVLRAEQTSLGVTAFSTDYEFKAGDIKLKVKFVSPLPPDDFETLSMPVCYMEFEIAGDAQAEISIFVNRAVSFNTALEPNAKTRGAVMARDGFESAFIGRKRQLYLSNNGDEMGADWGWWYLAGKQAFYADERDMAAYLAGGLKNFTASGDECYICAFDESKTGIFALGYDDVVAIDYYGDFRKGYYLQNRTIVDALETVWHGHKDIDKRLAAFDDELKKRAAPFGKRYLDVLYASLRQSIAAHKLVADSNGNALFLSKECGSNGCIATVDVSYPSMPLYLLYNTEAVKGMMRPIFEFARMPAWVYDFAPHDAGTYPHCCGNVYGLNSAKEKCIGTLAKPRDGADTHYPFYLLPPNERLYDPKYQMSVEECANMLIMQYACYRKDHGIAFFAENADLAEKWVAYLVEYGLRPEEQLCTDDFAGHLKNNLNLAIKATVGIGCYAELLKAANKGAPSKSFRNTAERFANEIVAFSEKFSHMPITWDADDKTFSLKYNLAFDKILDLGLFPRSLAESEVDFYLSIADKFGTPLDNRERYTKSDWLMWAAALTDDIEKKKKMVSFVDDFLKESPDRVPFSDWYYTDSGKHEQFVARSVQGGCFILLL